MVLWQCSSCLPLTCLGGASRWPTPPLQTSAALIRAGQLPRPPVGRGWAVPDGGPGCLLELTQGHSLCIPRAALQRHACHHHWVQCKGEADTMLDSYLYLGVRDLPRGRCGGRRRARHLPGLRYSPTISALGHLSSLPPRVMTETVVGFAPAHHTHSAVTAAEERTISDRKARLDHGPGASRPVLHNTTEHSSSCEWPRGGARVVPDFSLPGIPPRSLPPPCQSANFMPGWGGPRSRVRSARVSGDTRLQGDIPNRNDFSSAMHALSPHAETVAWNPCLIRGNGRLWVKSAVPIRICTHALPTAPATTGNAARQTYICSRS
jgi:hypothetical protein